MCCFTCRPEGLLHPKNQPQGPSTSRFLGCCRSLSRAALGMTNQEKPSHQEPAVSSTTQAVSLPARGRRYSIRQQHVDLAEARGGAAVAHGVDLRGLPLAVAGEAVVLPETLVGGRVHRSPEVGG